MHIEIKRLSHGVGAEIRGLTVADAPGDDVIRRILDAWWEHQVLVFRDVDMTLAQQVRFTRCFGELELHPLKSLRHPVHPEIFEVTNRKIDGKPSETGEIGRVWHSDGAYTVRPPTASLLYCRRIPDAGGTTWFNNMYMAYDELSEGMKQLIGNLEVVNDLFGLGPVTPFIAKAGTGDKDENSTVVQPIVRVHPVTKRKALYLNPAVTRRILGLTTEESEGLLQFLFRHSVKPEFVYCHRWRVNDLVMWDNRCAMHLAPADYPSSEVRQMFRTTLVGEPHGRYLSPSSGD